MFNKKLGISSWLALGGISLVLFAILFGEAVSRGVFNN